MWHQSVSQGYRLYQFGRAGYWWGFLVPRMSLEICIYHMNTFRGDADFHCVFWIPSWSWVVPIRNIHVWMSSILVPVIWDQPESHCGKMFHEDVLVPNETVGLSWRNFPSKLHFVGDEVLDVTVHWWLEALMGTSCWEGGGEIRIDI